jgi:type II secretory pathway component GspD/PulD (secretin)
MTFTKAATASALAFSFAFTLHAQSTDCRTLSTRTAMHDCAYQNQQIKVVQLTNATSAQQANEILVALRNAFDPADKMFLVGSRNQIVLASYPQENDRIEALIHELDKPHKTYRLTYTFTDIDAGKRTGTQHYSLLAVPGHMTQLKEGDKVPVATGNVKSGSPSSMQTQITYLDIGINLQATIEGAEQGAYLVYRVDQSSMSQKPSGVGPQDPAVHQTSLSGDTIIIPGKPTQLGSIDVPNSTRHIDIEVVAEPVQ